jgi:hypothetical protein
MLPRPQSYFLSDASFFWSNTDAGIFSSLPMRHEHQMFFGIVPFALTVVGLIVGSRTKNATTFTLMGGMLAIAVLLTIYVGGLSLWYFLHKFPLVSAIRAMTRLDLAFLFPVSYFSVIAIDYLRARYGIRASIFLGFILLVLLAETSMTTMGASSKEVWRRRIANLNADVPKENIKNNSILFFAQNSELPYADELDAMWVSLINKKKTMNGYSGLLPPGYDFSFGRDCAEVPKRVLSYLEFANKSENFKDYHELISRVVPVGFNDCNPDWLNKLPSITSSDRIYTAEEFKNLSLELGKLVNNSDLNIITIAIKNNSDIYISANSSVGRPVRISWRFIDISGNPLNGWETRRNLPFDIPANGKIIVAVPLNMNQRNINAYAVQFSLVHELVFWAHDIGVSPLTITLNKIK